MSSIGPFTFCELIKGLEEMVNNESTTEMMKQQIEEEAEQTKEPIKEEETKEEVKSVSICGTVFYLTEKVFSQIPYFDSLLSGRYATNTTESGAIQCDSVDPELFKVIVKYIERNKELHVLLGHLPKEQSAFELFKLYDFLCLESPINKDLESVKSMLLEPISSVMNYQEDIVKYAFALFYAFGKIDWKHRYQRKYRNSIYEKVYYALETSDGWSQPRAKFHLKQISLKCVCFSMNQFLRISKFSLPDELLAKNDKKAYKSVMTSYLDGMSDFYDSDSDYYDSDDYDDDSPYWSDSDWFDLHNWSEPEDMFEYLCDSERMFHYKWTLGEDFDYGEYFAGEYLHFDKYMPV